MNVPGVIESAEGSSARASRLPGVARRILIVDDDCLSRAAITALLEADGFCVSGCPDGAAAMLEAARAPPDVVLTDLHMPEMNGVELCIRLRAIDGEVPVILMTASADMETVVAGMRAGADDYLTKPLHYDALLLSLERAITRREAKRDHERMHRALNAELVLSSLREQELGDAEARQRGQLNALLANLSEGVVIADTQGRIVMLNDVARSILGLEDQPRLDAAQRDDGGHHRQIQRIGMTGHHHLFGAVEPRDGQPQLPRLAPPVETNVPAHADPRFVRRIDARHGCAAADHHPFQRVEIPDHLEQAFRGKVRVDPRGELHLKRPNDPSGAARTADPFLGR